MKIKCKQVLSKAMQLQVHPGLVTKAENVKGLGWLVPSLWGGRPALCLTVHVHKISLLDLCTIGLLTLLQH